MMTQSFVGDEVRVANALHTAPFLRFDPVQFFGPGFSFVRDERSDKLGRVDYEKVVFEPFIFSRESSGIGAGRPHLNFDHFLDLWQNTWAIPASFGSGYYITFGGDTLLSPKGDEYTLYFYLSRNRGWRYGYFSPGSQYLPQCRMAMVKI